MLGFLVWAAGIYGIFQIPEPSDSRETGGFLALVFFLIFGWSFLCSAIFSDGERSIRAPSYDVQDHYGRPL